MDAQTTMAAELYNTLNAENKEKVKNQEMLAEAFDLIQKLSDEQLQKIMEALK